MINYDTILYNENIQILTLLYAIIVWRFKMHVTWMLGWRRRGQSKDCTDEDKTSAYGSSTPAWFPESRFPISCQEKMGPLTWCIYPNYMETPVFFGQLFCCKLIGQQRLNTPWALSIYRRLLYIVFGTRSHLDSRKECIEDQEYSRTDVPLRLRYWPCSYFLLA